MTTTKGTEMNTTEYKATRVANGTGYIYRGIKISHYNARDAFHVYYDLEAESWLRRFEYDTLKEAKAFIDKRHSNAWAKANGEHYGH